MLSARVIAITSLVGASVVCALNDWNVPCTSGECSYDLPASADGTSSGTVRIWGPKGAISDITTAAGWEIIGCDSDAVQQDIRLICADESKCQHLLRDGAEGKIIRLPENCGASAFARVARSWVSEDQSLPSELAKRLVKRDGTTPEVQALSLDTNFVEIDPERWGAVNIAIRGANVPSAPPEVITAEAKRRRSHPRDFRRNIFDDFVDGTIDFVGDAIDSIASLNDFSISEEVPLPPISVDERFNIFSQSFGCPPAFEASVNVDVAARATALVTIGVAATGTIVPPQFDDIAIISNFNADIDGALIMSASATGTLNSGKITLFQIGIPGLDFPGILTIGPTFEIAAQAIATLDANVDLEVGIKYSITNAQMRFPRNDANNDPESFSINDTPLQLSATPSAAATGRVEGHLIPSINFGISALGNFADSKVFLNLDAAAIMQLNLEASTQFSAELSARSIEVPVTRQSALDGALVDVDYTKPIWSRGMRRRQEEQPTVSPEAELATETQEISDGADVVNNDGIGIDFGGCFELKAGLSVNVGAESNFFGLFDAATQFDLFSREFELFKRCLGQGPEPAVQDIVEALKSGISNLGSAVQDLRRRQNLSGLVCPAVQLASPKPVAKEVVRPA